MNSSLLFNFHNFIKQVNLLQRIEFLDLPKIFLRYVHLTLLLYLATYCCFKGCLFVVIQSNNLGRLNF